VSEEFDDVEELVNDLNFSSEDLEVDEFPMLRNVPVEKHRREMAAYHDEYAGQAEKLCLLLGATTNDLALFFGVNATTVERWQKRHPAFAEAVKRGKMVADSHVAESLYRQASGIATVKRTKVFADPKSGQQMIVEYEEQLPPSTLAAIFWLKNRQPAQWRDRQKVEMKDLEKMTDEQLAAIASGQDPTGGG